MTKLIFVGYRTQVIAGYEALMPEFNGNAGTKDPEKIAEQIADKKAKWLLNAADQAYTGTFAEVHLLIPSLEKSFSFKAEGRGGDTGKPMVCRAVRDTLLKLFPNAWADNLHSESRKEVEAAFVGFEPRVFLKMLGLECTLPVHNCPLPVSLWYNNSDHRDVTKAVMPEDFKGLDWELVTKIRRIGLTGEDLVKYDALFKDWKGPGACAEQDAKIAWLLSGQLGFVDTKPIPQPVAEKKPAKKATFNAE